MCDMGCESGVASRQIPTPASLPAVLLGGPARRSSWRGEGWARHHNQHPTPLRRRGPPPQAEGGGFQGIRHGANVERVNRDGRDKSRGVTVYEHSLSAVTHTRAWVRRPRLTT